jgi:ureidoglycolate lyase
MQKSGDSMHLIAEPITADAFAPYGEVLEASKQPGRVYFKGALGNGRAHAAPSLSVTHAAPIAALPLTATLMERHEFSSQSFLPFDVERWLVIVADKAATGGPDTATARAFVVGPGQGITYRPDVWHHPLTVLDRPARFYVSMWEDGTATDTEFFTLPEPFTVGLAP